MSEDNINHFFDEHESAKNEIGKALVKTNTELALDIAEIGIDAATTGIFKELPGFKIAYGLYKSYSNIREIKNTNKIIRFLNAFHAGNIPEEKITKFRIDLEDNIEYRNKVLDTIMIYNERFINEKKSEYLANVLSAHVNEKITWDAYIVTANALERVEFLSLNYLKEICEQGYHKTELLMSEFTAMLFSAGLFLYDNQKIQVTTAGAILYKYGIMADINFEFGTDQHGTIIFP